MSPKISIPPVESVVKLDGVPLQACIRPELDEECLALGSFRPEEDTLIYARTGPYVLIYIKDVDLVSILRPGEVTLPDPFTGSPRWFGDMWMVGGRAACDQPEERRSFETLSISTMRLGNSTRFSLQARLGPRRDRGAWPQSMLLDMWFIVPDREIDRFVLRAEANEMFRRFIAA